MGYTRLRHYRGGIATWIDAGGPVERGGFATWIDERRPVEGEAGGGPVGVRAASGTPSVPIVASGRPVPRRSLRVRNGWSDRVLDAVAATSFGTLLWLWLGIVVASGLGFWAVSAWAGPSLMEGGVPVSPTWRGLATAVYFSFVTATSVGFGDVVPVGAARPLAVLESAAGLLIFGCIISKLVSRRQDQLLEETHRNAFEARLGRVRTNLHLVLSELQSISLEITERKVPSGRVLPRLESAVMVFGGELRTIHDLLYRPQQAPEGPVLEAILATLAASMREFSELLDAFPGARDRSPILRSGLTVMSRVAGEICGECVPREYAPELKVWMDRIQEIARKLAPA